MENHSVGLITSILLLLVVARILGELMNRLKLSPVVGEILAGIILGPALLGYVTPSAELAGIAELSVFLILLSAGLEMNFNEVMSAFLGRGAILGAIGFIIPMAAGLLLGLVFQLAVTPSIILALVLAITALPVIIRILENFDLLDTKVARYAIATAIFNDIVALGFLGVILGLGASATQKTLTFTELLQSVSATGGKLLIFACLIVGLVFLMGWGGKKTGYIQRLLERTIKFFGKEALFGVTVLFVLVIGALSEELSSHFVIGVFFGGLMISKEVIGRKLFKDLESTINSISGGFLAPIFFAVIGLNFKIDPLQSWKGALFAVAVILVSISSKIISARVGGKLAGVRLGNALGVGILLNSRGTMDLVVADIALTRNLINQDLFSTLVLLGVTSTVVSPIMFRKMVLSHLVKAKEREKVKAKEEAAKAIEEESKEQPEATPPAPQKPTNGGEGSES